MTLAAILRAHLRISSELRVVLLHDREVDHFFGVLCGHVGSWRTFASRCLLLGCGALWLLTVKLSLAFVYLLRLVCLPAAGDLLLSLGARVLLLGGSLASRNLNTTFTGHPILLRLSVFAQLLVEPLNLLCKLLLDFAFGRHRQRNAQLVRIGLFHGYLLLDWLLWRNLTRLLACSDVLGLLGDGRSLGVRGRNIRGANGLFLDSFRCLRYLIYLIILSN